jgi:type IV secretion system protein VirD4
VDFTAHGRAFLILKQGGGMAAWKWFINIFYYEEVLYLFKKEIEAASQQKIKPNITESQFHARTRLRIVWLKYLLIGWWGLSCFWIGVFLLIDIAAIWQHIALQHSFSRSGSRPYGGSVFDEALPYISQYGGSVGAVNLAYDLWVLLALWILKHTWKVRLKGFVDLKPLGLLTLIAIVFGRGAAFAWSFLYALIPDWWLLWPLKYLLLPLITLVLGGAPLLLAFYFAVTTAIAALFVLPMKIIQAALNIKQQADMMKFQKTPFIGALLEGFLWFTGQQLEPPEEMPDDTKGARLAIEREIRAAQDTQNGTAFGQVGGQPLMLPNDKHALIMASTRSGKGVSLIIPHLLRYQGSAFVLDPKGENAKATIRQRRKLNQTVHVLDPFGLTGLPQARFNPLSRFTPENMEAESKALAAALILGDRDHWTASAQQLLAAFILFVVTNEKIPQEQKDLRTVRMLLLSSPKITLKAMQESRAAEGLLSMLAISFLETPEKEFGSILSTTQRETEILDNPYIAACLAAGGDGEEVNFAAWHNGTMTVYLCLSAPKFPVFSRWLRLVLTSALDEMTDRLDPPPLPVCFMLDELAALGHLEAVENAVGLAAGYGIQLWNVFQDIGQIKDLYKGRWPSFIGNAGVRVVFNLDDLDSADYWSRFIGQRLVETKSVSQNVMGQVTGGGHSETLRPLLSSDDLMYQFATHKMLVLAQGLRPVVADRMPYFVDRDLGGLWDDPRVKAQKPVNPNEGFYPAQTEIEAVPHNPFFGMYSAYPQTE